MSTAHDPSQFAAGLSEAESQSRALPELSSTKQHEQKQDGAGGAQAVDPSDVNHPVDPRLAGNAPVWKEYLNHAKAHDDELAKVLSNDLDSLLIFAGLFSAILTAFLIEIRKALQQDLQSTTNDLLMAIIRRMDNVTSPVAAIPQFEPATSSIWVNALWFLSLTLSLVSALVAILAKGWVTQYAASSSSEISAHSACLRHGRWIGVTRWHLKTIIGCIPIFIHAAFFAFFAGLVILLHQDDVAIQNSVLALVVVAVFIYAATTFLPIFYPDCPFRTPVSDLVTRVVDKLQSVSVTPHGTDIMADALAWLLSLSTREDVVRMSVEAIAALPATVQVQAALCRSNVAHVLSRGLSERIRNFRSRRLSASVDVDDHNHVEAYLHAILHLVQTAQPGGSTHMALLPLVKPGGALDDWKDLGAGAAELALCFKARFTLLHLSREDAAELFDRDIPVICQSASQMQNRRMLAEIVIMDNVADLLSRLKDDDLHTRIEGLEELASHAKYELEPATIIKDHGIQKIVESISNVDTQLTALGTIGKFAEHDGLRQAFLNHNGVKLVMDLAHKDLGENQVIWEKTVKDLAKYKDIQAKLMTKDMVAKIVSQLKHELSIVQNNALQCITQLSSYDDIREKLLGAGMGPILVSMLNKNDPEVQDTVVKAVSALSRYGDVRANITTTGIMTMLLTSLKEDYPDIQTTSLQAIIALSQYEDVQAQLTSRDAVTTLLHILKHHQTHVRTNALQCVLQLSDYDDIRRHLLNGSLIMMLVDMLNGSSSLVKAVALQVIAHISKHEDVQSILLTQDIIVTIVNSLKHDHPLVQINALQAISHLSKHQDIRAALMSVDVIPVLLSTVEYYDLVIRVVGVKTLTVLSSFGDTKSKLMSSDTVISVLFGLLKESSRALNAIPKSSQYENIHASTNTIPIFVDIVENIHLILENTGLAAIPYLLRQAKKIYNDIILILVSLLRHDNLLVQTNALNAISQLSNHEVIRLKLKSNDMIDGLISWLKNQNPHVQSTMLQLVSQLSKYEDVQVKFLTKGIINILVELLTNNHPLVQTNALQTISEVVKYKDIRTKLISAYMLSMLISTLKHINPDVQTAGIQVISTLSKYEDVHAELMGANMMPTLIGTLKDTNEVVRNATLTVISELLQQAKLGHILCHGHLIPHLSGMLFHCPLHFQAIRASVLSSLAKYEDIRAAAISSGLVLPLLLMLQSQDLNTCIAAAEALAVLGVYD